MWEKFNTLNMKAIAVYLQERIVTQVQRQRKVVFNRLTDLRKQADLETKQGLYQVAETSREARYLALYRGALVESLMDLNHHKKADQEPF